MNLQGYQTQYKQAFHQHSANLQVTLAVHNLMQGQGNKIQPHRFWVPNLQTVTIKKIQNRQAYVEEELSHLPTPTIKMKYSFTLMVSYTL